MHTLGTLLLCVSSGLFLCLNANAQWDASSSAGLGAGYGQMALSQAILSNTSNSKLRVKNSRSPLNFYSIKNQELYNYKKSYAAIIASMHKGSDENAIFDKLTDVDYAFNNKIRSYGLNQFYISDRLTTYIAWSWEMYHHKRPSNAQVTNMNNKIQANMATAKNQKMLIALSDQQKANWLLNFSFNVTIAAQYLENEKTKSDIIVSNNAALAAACKEIGVDIKNPLLF